MPCFSLQETDPDFDHCAVCIESYKQNDVVRILPCKYVRFLCLKQSDAYVLCMSPFQSGDPTCFREPPLPRLEGDGGAAAPDPWWEWPRAASRAVSAQTDCRASSACEKHGEKPPDTS